MKSRIHVREQQSAKLRITIPVTPSPTQYQIELAVFTEGQRSRTTAASCRPFKPPRRLMSVTTRATTTSLGSSEHWHAVAWPRQLRASGASALRAENRVGRNRSSEIPQLCSQKCRSPPLTTRKTRSSNGSIQERLMGVSRQAEFSAAKMSKVLLWVEAYIIEAKSMSRQARWIGWVAAKAAVPVMAIRASMALTQSSAERAQSPSSAQGQRWRRRCLRRINRAAQQQFGDIEIGGGSPQPHLNAQNLGDGDTTRAAPAFGPVAENLIRAQCRTQHRRDESQCLTDCAHHFEPVSRPRP
jgi:hypothetical protein